MTGEETLRRCRFAALAGLLGLAMSVACHSTMTPENSAPPTRDINAVLRDHDRQLLARPGVVGVYVGLLDDGKTPCLKVMLARKDRDLERSLPPFLEGYRVVPEVTGELKPLGRAETAR